MPTIEAESVDVNDTGGQHPFNRDDDEPTGPGWQLLLAVAVAIIASAFLGLVAWNHWGPHATPITDETSATAPAGPWIEGIDSERWSVDMTGPSTLTVEGQTVGVWRVHLVDATGTPTGYRWCQLGANRTPARCLSRVHSTLDNQIEALRAPVATPAPTPAPTAAVTTLPEGIKATGNPALVAEYMALLAMNPGSQAEIKKLPPGSYEVCEEEGEVLRLSPTPCSPTTGS